MLIDRRLLLKCFGLLPLIAGRPSRVVAMASFKEQTLARPGRLSLWYGQAASEWEEALPVGNGRLGAQ